MNKYWKYLKYVLRHKWYVGKFLWQMGLYCQAINHDMSKLLPSPFKAYTNYFYGPKKKYTASPTWHKPVETADKDFDYAWLIHQRINRHHWQFWILICDNGNIKYIEIPEKYIKEMVCDWWGASIATGNSNSTNYKEITRKWYERNKYIIWMNDKSRKTLENLLEIKS